MEMPNNHKIEHLSEEAASFFENKKLLFAAWACENKTNDSYQVFYKYMSQLFGRTIIFDPQKEVYSYGKDRMNENFLKIIAKEKPDYIFLWLIYEEFYPETLIKIKKISPKTKIINFFGDDDTQFEIFTRHFGLFIDYPICFPQLRKKIYEKEKIDNIFFSCMINTDVFKPMDVEKKYDVTFVGTPKSDRMALLLYLKKNGVNIRVFGWGWNAYPEFREVYGGALDDKEFVKVINQSKINLCLSKNYLNELHIKGRAFNVNACKSFALLEYFERYLDFFKDNKEIVMFKDKEDLLKKIKYYLMHDEERERIAEKAYKKIINNYSLKIEFGDFFQKVYSERSLPPKTILPNADGKVLNLKMEDLDSENIKERLKNIVYVKFLRNGKDCSAYRDYFQAYSIKKSKKPISCCDYYVHSHGLGNYLLFPSYFAFKLLNKEDFTGAINPEQLMVEKNYFLRNISKFRRLFCGGKAEIMNAKNTTFVGIPLVKVTKIKELGINEMNKLFLPVFEIKLRNILHQKKLLQISYLCKMIFSSYPYKRLVLGHLLRKFMTNFKKLF